MDKLPDPPVGAEAAELRRRRRGRNWAMMLALVALCALFYAITIVKLTHS